MQTIQGQCIVYFYHEDGTALKDNNNSCRTANGNVAIGEYFIPDRKENVYEDFSLFIPYNELHLSDERKTNLKANVILWTSSPSQQAKQLAVSDWFYFWYGSQN